MLSIETKNKLNGLFLNWSDPKVAFRNSVFFLFFWLSVGGLHEKYFVKGDFILSAYAEIENAGREVTVNWYNDYFGHWAIAFAIVISLLLIYWNTQTTISASKELEGIMRKKHEKHSFNVSAIIFFLCFVFSILNTYLLSTPNLADPESIIQWQYADFNWVLPGMIAFLFFMFVMFPIFLCILRFCIRLNSLAKNCELVRSYNVRDPNAMFGLESFGQLIFTTVSLFFLATFPLITVQIFQKNGQVTLSSFFGFAIAFTLLYFIAIRPLLAFYSNLLGKRIEFLNEHIESRKNLEEKLKTISIDKGSVELDVVVARLQEVNSNIELGRKLKTIPVSIKSKFSAAVAAVPSLAGIIFKVVEIINEASV